MGAGRTSSSRRTCSCPRATPPTSSLSATRCAARMYPPRPALGLCLCLCLCLCLSSPIHKLVRYRRGVEILSLAQCFRCRLEFKLANGEKEEVEEIGKKASALKNAPLRLYAFTPPVLDVSRFEKVAIMVHNKTCCPKDKKRTWETICPLGICACVCVCACVRVCSFDCAIGAREKEPLHCNTARM